MVYVQDIDGKPMMPTTRHGKVRQLLKDKKAVVINTCPFTIKLTYKTSDYKQEIVLGVDAGIKHVGLSATTKSKELYSGEVILRNDVVELLSTRRESRRARRNRLRYRKPRFENRVKSKRLGWVAPSVRHKVDAHIRVIDNICSTLPISRIIVEIAQFDTQKIKNPDISGNEYQEGDQLGFWNVREYVLARDGHKCQHCKGKSKDPILNVHHIESRKTGGDSPSNLITLCETCHKEYHKGNIDLKVKRGKSLRDAAVMGIMKWKLYEELKSRYPNVSMTFGYITKYNRIKYGIEKSHTSDAFVISRNFNAKRIERQYLKRLIRRHNRQIHKMKILKGGKKKNNQAPFEVFGFRLFDKVLYNNEICFIYGRRKSGCFDIRDFDGKNSKNVTYKKLKLIRGKRYPIILK
nr:MAG: RRXRR protein [Bacteriophage sp.]